MVSSQVLGRATLINMMAILVCEGASHALSVPKQHLGVFICTVLKFMRLFCRCTRQA